MRSHEPSLLSDRSNVCLRLKGEFRKLKSTGWMRMGFSSSRSLEYVRHTFVGCTPQLDRQTESSPPADYSCRRALPPHGNDLESEHQPGQSCQWDRVWSPADPCPLSPRLLAQQLWSGTTVSRVLTRSCGRHLFLNGESWFQAGRGNLLVDTPEHHWVILK